MPPFEQRDRVLHAMLADTPLVKNLETPEYMKILLNGKECLEVLFAEMNREKIFGALTSGAGADQILPGFSGLMKKEAFLNRDIRVITTGQISTKSN